MMKKLLTGVLAFVLALSLFGCGSSGGKETGAGAGNIGGSIDDEKDVLSTVGNNTGQNGDDSSEEAASDAQTEAGVDLTDVLLSVRLDGYQGDQLAGSQTIETEYDAQGRQIVGFYIHQETKGRITRIFATEYRYDQDGRVIYSRNNQLNETYYTYDEDGRLVREDSSETPTEVSVYTTYTYDEAGNLISIWEGQDQGTYWENGEQKQGKVCSNEYLYTYADGKLIHMEHNWNGSTETEDYTYNSAGQLETTKCVGQYGSESLITYTYDGEGKLLKAETTYELHGETKVQRTDEYTYDELGRVLTWTITPGSVMKYVLTYQYGEY